MHIDNKNKIILIIDEGATPGLHDTTLTAETKYSIKFLTLKKICVMSILQWKQNSLIC